MRMNWNVSSWFLRDSRDVGSALNDTTSWYDEAKQRNCLSHELASLVVVAFAVGRTQSAQCDTTVDGRIWTLPR